MTKSRTAVAANGTLVGFVIGLVGITFATEDIDLLLGLARVLFFVGTSIMLLAAGLLFYIYRKDHDGVVCVSGILNALLALFLVSLYWFPVFVGE